MNSKQNEANIPVQPFSPHPGINSVDGKLFNELSSGNMGTFLGGFSKTSNSTSNSPFFIRIVSQDSSFSICVQTQESENEEYILKKVTSTDSFFEDLKTKTTFISEHEALKQLFQEIAACSPLYIAIDFSYDPWKSNEDFIRHLIMCYGMIAFKKENEDQSKLSYIWKKKYAFFYALLFSFSFVSLYFCLLGSEALKSNRRCLSLILFLVGLLLMCATFLLQFSEEKLFHDQKDSGPNFSQKFRSSFLPVWAGISLAMFSSFVRFMVTNSSIDKGGNGLPSALSVFVFFLNAFLSLAFSRKRLARKDDKK